MARGKAPNGTTQPPPDREWLTHRDHAHRTHFQRRPSLRERETESLLKAWYGDAEGREEIIAHQAAAGPIGDSVGQVLEELGLAMPVLFVAICEAWPAIVGADVARRTRPVELAGTTLVVEVQDSTWLYVLQTVQRGTLGRQVREFSQNAVTDVKVIARGRFRPPGGK